MIEGLTVVELAGSVAGGYAAKLLADFGARVHVVGEVSRPRWGSTAGMSLYLDRAKSVAGDLGDRDLAMLIAESDVVIESSAPDPLASTLDRYQPDSRRVDVAISPFGSAGPLANHRSTDLTDQAIAGHLYLNGDPDREPLQGPDHQVAYAAGAHAAIGALAAVQARLRTGRGQRVEVTHHEVMTALHQFTLLRQTHNGDILRRMGNRYAGPGQPAGVYRCGDGLISLIAPRGDQLESIIAVTGLDHLLELPGVDGVYGLMHHPTLLDEHLGAWLRDQDLQDTIELFQAMRIPAGSVSTIDDLLEDDHLGLRGFWSRVEHEGRTVRVPGPAASITAAAEPTAPTESMSGSAGPAPGSVGLGDGPLTGLRVLDLTRVWAGPYATRILADLGADVIMIEAPWARGGPTVDHVSVMATHFYPDDDPGLRHWNRTGFANKYNINKRNLAVNLNKPDGLALLEALIPQADVLIENYSPRVMPQFGLDESRLHELNPSLIYITMPGFGRTGPSRDRVAYGPIIDSQAGLSVLMGYEGETARKGGVAWPDPVAGMHAAAATLAALLARSTDGRGRTVELAQVEVTAAMAGHAIADRQLTGRASPPIGNRHAELAPHGVYPVDGDDRWVAIAVVDDAGWRGLCRLAAFDPSWEGWTSARRQAESDRIDEVLAAWTGPRDGSEVVAALQATGVAAALVADAADVMADAHHHDRRFFVELAHPEAGTHRWPGLPIRLWETPASYRRPGPCLNEHADELLGELVGLDSEAIQLLRTSGVIADRPPDH